MKNHEHKFEASKSGKTETCECGSWRWSDAKGSIFASAEQVRTAEARAEAARKGEMTPTAAELRQQAVRTRDRAAESFERCDTDGFLSQGAGQIMALVYETQADILDNGGRAVFIGLYEGDRRVPAKIIQTQFGSTWLLDEAADQARFGRKFIPIGDNSRVQKSLGLTERQEWQEAWAKCGGWSSVHTYRQGDQCGRGAELCKEEDVRCDNCGELCGEAVGDATLIAMDIDKGDRPFQWGADCSCGRRRALAREEEKI